MRGFCVYTPKLSCPECGHTLLYVGRGRHKCTNPDCPVLNVRANRQGRVFKVIKEVSHAG